MNLLHLHSSYSAYPKNWWSKDGQRVENVHGLFREASSTKSRNDSKYSADNYREFATSQSVATAGRSRPNLTRGNHHAVTGSINGRAHSNDKA